jgi:hypothetical protein
MLQKTSNSSLSLVVEEIRGLYTSYCLCQSTFRSSKNGYLLWNVFHNASKFFSGSRLVKLQPIFNQQIWSDCHRVAARDLMGKANR